MGLNNHLAQQYSKGSILLHWLIAFALAGELALGFVMPHDASGFALFQLHKSIGITIMLLTVLRVVWRLTHRTPPALEGGLGGFLAKAVHLLFYAFMILAPLTGWAIVSSAEIDVPTLLFGVVPWPDLPVSQALNHTFEEVHELLAFGGIALFVLHVAGALRHHFLLGDRLLSRMSPTGQPLWALLLGAGVVLTGAAVFFGIGPSGEHHHDDHEEQAVSTEETPLAEPVAELQEEAVDDEVTEEEAADEEEAVEEEEVAAPEPAGPPPRWTIQPGGSLRFSVANGGSAMNGSFGEWSGRIVMDPDHPETAEIAIDVQLASASMSDAQQNQMLRGAEFLAAAANPVATWRSNSVTAQGNGRYRANGTLNLKGVSRAQAITFTLSGSGDRRAVTGQAVIDRGAFSVGGASAADLANDVTVSFSFDATR